MKEDKELLKDFDADTEIDVKPVDASAWSDEPDYSPKRRVWQPRPQRENTLGMGEPDCEHWIVSPPLEDWYGHQLSGTGAMPHWSYPNPGQPSTRELDQQESTESSLHITANMDLNLVLLYLQLKQEKSGYAEGLAESAAKKLEFLRGLWQGKQVRVPPIEELEAMAMRPRGKEWLALLTEEQVTRAKSFKTGQERWKYLMEVLEELKANGRV